MGYKLVQPSWTFCAAHEDNQMRVYYAHCIAIYNTPQEQRDIEALENLGFDVVNPNNPDIDQRCAHIRKEWSTLHLPGTGELRDKYGPYDDAGHAIMEIIFRPLVSASKCDGVVFRGLPDGRIPAGVLKELDWARECGLPILELPSNFTGRSMTVDHTREYLREIGAR